MKRFLRPTTLIVLLGVVLVAATAWVFWSTRQPGRPMPLPVDAEDREIAWINSATASTNWQRFVQAVVAVTGEEAGAEAFPRLTTDVPEVAVPLPGQRGKLRIRWYKVTSELKHSYWVDALVRRHPPPLAIIGGNTTDTAADQARQLRRASERLDESRRPLLLLTTATADRVPSDTSPSDPDGVPLTNLYPGRVFRFCFSNRQIGEAVTRFIWEQPELRPDAFPIYTVEWKDDAYSADLIRGFIDAVGPFIVRDIATGASRDWGLGAGFAGAGGFPLAGLTVTEHPAPDALFPWPTFIPWSVGSFDRPNRYEAESAAGLLDHLDRHPRQRRALLVLSGQSGPSRRFVRALARLSPLGTRRIVLASGDTIAFNTIVRDRNVTWPIQDLPCSLVVFCHNNPIAGTSADRPRDQASGTEDLLLYQDIVSALIGASTQAGKPADADALRDGLQQLRVRDGLVQIEGGGPLLFDEQGNRRTGTGEHVVWLRPAFADDRTLPEATIHVAAWKAGRAYWRTRDKPFRILYTGAKSE